MTNNGKRVAPGVTGKGSVQYGDDYAQPAHCSAADARKRELRGPAQPAKVICGAAPVTDRLRDGFS